MICSFTTNSGVLKASINERTRTAFGEQLFSIWLVQALLSPSRHLARHSLSLSA
jgi:hypothetical protein